MGSPHQDGQGHANRPVPDSQRRSRLGRLLHALPWELRFLLLSPLYIGVPLVLLLGAAFTYYTAQIPNPMILRHKERAPAIRILARDGSLLTDRGAVESYVPLDQLPQHLIDAVVATEDRRFFEHYGLDPIGLLRAAYVNLRSGRVSQGGSTLTQQLAKNLFLSSERSLARKLEELVLALWLEARLGKRNVLELYLNRVYFGGGAYGVEAAAQRFFNKPARQLTLPEAAVLAGLLKAPSKFSPASSPEVARARARTVLAKMVECGLLTPVGLEAAAAAPLAFADRHLGRDRAGVDYAVDAVLEKLPALVGAKPQEIVVETTIDLGLQKRAQALVLEKLGEGNAAGASQAGMLMMELDGAVRVLVGGRSYAESQYNRALRAKRQPGSAFKVFVYLAALEKGLKPDSTVHDLPILGAGWSPRNEGSGYRGSVSMREALTRSLNAATARLHLSVGPRNTAKVAHRLGIASDLRPDASLALGTSEVTLSELTAAYGAVANQGRTVEPYLIRRVRTTAGRVLYTHRAAAGKTVIAPAHVAALNDMLSSVVQRGTGRRAQIPHRMVAGKTGTSQDFRDAWFVGYTGQMVGGVWIGNDDSRPMNRVMGGTLPAELWREVMTAAHDHRPALALPTLPREVTSPVEAHGSEAKRQAPAERATAGPARAPAEEAPVPSAPVYRSIDGILNGERAHRAERQADAAPSRPSGSSAMRGLLRELGIGPTAPRASVYQTP